MTLYVVVLVSLFVISPSSGLSYKLACFTRSQQQQQQYKQRQQLRQRCLRMSAASASFKLYGNQGTRSPLVNWYLEEINAPYEQIDATRVDRSSYASDGSGYPHPFGSIPAAADAGGVQLFESGAILMFIADKYGGLDTPEKRAAVSKWIFWANASLDPICFKENDRGQVIGTRLTESPRAIAVLEELLGKSEWILGDGEDNFSAADVAIGSYVLYALLFNRGLQIAPQYPNLARYCEKCARRRAYQKAFTPEVAAMLAERSIAGMESGGGKIFGLF